MIDRFPRRLRALHQQPPQLSAPRPASEAGSPRAAGSERIQHPARLRLEVLDELAHLEQPVVLCPLIDDDESGRGMGRARFKITE